MDLAQHVVMASLMECGPVQLSSQWRATGKWRFAQDDTHAIVLYLLNLLGDTGIAGVPNY